LESSKLKAGDPPFLWRT